MNRAFHNYTSIRAGKAGVLAAVEQAMYDKDLTTAQWEVAWKKA